MKKLAGFYFTGTGNTKYVAERLCRRLGEKYDAELHEISDGDSGAEIANADTLLLAYPIYGSTPPVPMREFLYRHRAAVVGKEVIIAVTQYMFSGDGAASLGRAAAKYGANVRYAEHFRMPNNLSDCKVFGIRNGIDTEEMLAAADSKIDRFASKILAEKKTLRGFGIFSHALGYFSQRALFRKHEEQKRKKFRVDPAKCVGCGACVHCCPVGNLVLRDGKAEGKGKCALCYRCVNICPHRAIAIFGKNTPDVQYKGIYKRRKST